MSSLLITPTSHDRGPVVLVRLGALDASLARAGSVQALVSDATALRIGGGYFMCFGVPDARGCVTTRQDRLRGGC